MDDDLTTAERRLIKKAVRAAHAKGEAAGYERGRRDARDLLDLAARLNGTLPHVAKALAPEPEPDPAAADDGDPHHAAALALIDHAIEEAEAGRDPGAGLDAILDLLDDPAALAAALGGGDAPPEAVAKCVGWLVVRKAFDESKHPRDKSGHFISKDALKAAQADPKKAAELRAKVKPEDAGKLNKILDGTEDPGRTKRGQARHEAKQRRLTREEARDKTADLIKHMKRVGDLKEKLDPSKLYDLAEHLRGGHMTVAEMRQARAALSGTANRAGFGGGRVKEDMAKAMADHARGAALKARAKEMGMDPDEMRAAAGAKPKPKRPPKAAEKSSTVAAAVRRLGGLDPSSLDLKRFYENSTRATQDSVPLGVFKTGGRGLDQLAQELQTAGVIRVPDGVDPSEHLLDQMRKGAHDHAADLSAQYEDALDAHYRLVSESAGHPDRPGIEEALRLGEAAGRAEGAEGARRGDGGDVDARDDEEAGDAANVEGGDDSFDFGFNAAPEPVAPAAATATPVPPEPPPSPPGEPGGHPPGHNDLLARMRRRDQGGDPA